MNLKEKIKKLPSSPGVYLMKDSLNSVIYVGKSKKLKNRVKSYFQNSKSHSSKIVKLVKNLKDFEYILTDTEFEALMLECKLIKEIKPIYNKLMKNPKSYSYIKVKINEKYPDIELASESSKDDDNIYLGPYTNKNTVERALQGIKECCKILCNNTSQKAYGCLNYSLGLCIGMCLDKTPSQQYSSIFEKILNLLNGTDKSILEEMEYTMNTASENFDFENAAKYRDYISAVKYLLSNMKVVDFIKENKNIALLEYLDDDNFKFFLIKGNELLFSEKYTIKNFSSKQLKSILKTKILFYFNDEILKDSIEIRKEKLDESQIIYNYLKNKSISSYCKHIIILDNWLSDMNNMDIDNALNKLLFNLTNLV